jgi:hypothetical protein
MVIILSHLSNLRLPRSMGNDVDSRTALLNGKPPGVMGYQLR